MTSPAARALQEGGLFAQLAAAGAARAGLGAALADAASSAGGRLPAGLGDARRAGGPDLYRLLFGRDDFSPVMVATSRLDAFRQRVLGAMGRPAPLPPPAPPATPAAPLARPPAPPIPAAQKPATQKEEPPPMSDSMFAPVVSPAALSAPLHAPAPPTAQASAGADDATFARFLQKVTAVTNSLMAQRDTFPAEVAQQLDLPLQVVEDLAGNRGHAATLETVFRVLAHLGAVNLSLGASAPRPPGPR